MCKHSSSALTLDFRDGLPAKDREDAQIIILIIKANCENSLSVNSDTNLHYQPDAKPDPLCGRLFSLRLGEFELALMLEAGATDLHTGG